MADEIVIEDQLPGAMPELGFGDLLRWAPLIEQVITTVEAAIAGGALQIPALHLRIHGQPYTLGPTPLVRG